MEDRFPSEMDYGGNSKGVI